MNMSLNKYLFFFLFVFITINPISGQNGCFEVDWEENYGGTGRDWGNTIIMTTDGGYAMTGYSRSADGDVGGNNGDWDFWIIKINADGTLTWERNYGGSQNDESTAIQQTTDGGYIVAGATFSNDGDVSSNNGEEDFWIIKLDSNGNLQWEQTFGGTDVDRAEAIQQTADGGYIAAGFSASLNGDVGGNFGNFDFWLIKLDAGGNLLWEQNYGGSGPDWAYELETTSDGGFLLSGSTISTDHDVLDNNGFYDYWVIKVDQNGTLLWSQNFGGTGEDRAYFVREATDGNYIISGSTYSNNDDVGGNFGGSDFWIIKIDVDGNLIWEENFGGQGSEWAWAVDITDDGGAVVTGRTNTANGTGNVSSNNGGTDFWLIKLSDNGELEWENSFGGSSKEVPYSVHQTNDMGYVIAGYSESSDLDVGANNGDWDYWVLKLKPRDLDLDIGNDTTLCTGESLLVFAGIGIAAEFVWQDGSIDSTFLVSQEGMVSVEVTAGDCVLEDSLMVDYLDIEIVDIGADTSFCFSEIEPLLLDATVADADAYFWQDGSTDSTLTVLRGGTYWVEVDIDGCISTDSIFISFNNPSVNLGRDTFKCENEPFALNAFYPDATYLWSDGSTERRLVLQDTGTYWVTVDLNGCQESDTIHVDLCEIVRDPCLEFPNAFTPNGDGLNDLFRPVSFCRLESYQISIYNRYGEQIFGSENVEEGWDGFYNNRKPLQGVYVYVAEYSYKLDDVIYNETAKGVFAIVR